MKTTQKLTFQRGNAKLRGAGLAIFSVPAGHTCPGADLCRSLADRATGKLREGDTVRPGAFRCYAATAENFLTSVRVGRWNNFDKLREAKTCEGMAALILRSIPKKTVRVRIHGSGDFFSQTYFDAWIKAATARPDVVFYGYTKSLNFLIPRLGSIPSNMRIVASEGGRWDHLINIHALRFVRVVFSEKQAADAGLKIDHDDNCCWNYAGNFAALIHSTQPAKTAASAALFRNREAGIKGYSIGGYGSKKK